MGFFSGEHFLHVIDDKAFMWDSKEDQTARCGVQGRNRRLSHLNSLYGLDEALSADISARECASKYRRT